MEDKISLSVVAHGYTRTIHDKKGLRMISDATDMKFDTDLHAQYTKKNDF